MMQGYKYRALKSRLTANNITLAFLSILFAGCSNGHHERSKLAEKLSSQAGFSKVERATPLFLITSYEKVEKASEPANIYIEGDGLAWISRRLPSHNPTPANPVALRLAVKDAVANIVYLARPCQYSGLVKKNAPCPSSYWTSKRFSPEVVEAFHTVLDQLRLQHSIPGFNLIGFSGGANIAALLAARRSDIISLRTVAGNLDHRAHSRLHNVSRLTGSLNASDEAIRLASIPQYHFIGAEDKIVPLEILKSYTQALPNLTCLQYSIIDGASHTTGWVERWRTLIKMPPKC